MCYHKTLAIKEQELLDHYAAAFETIIAKQELQ